MFEWISQQADTFQQALERVFKENTIKGVIVENKSGRSAILAKIVIDCTGDGDIAARSGVPYEKGRPEDGLLQPMTMMFRLGNVVFQQENGTANSWNLL